MSRQLDVPLRSGKDGTSWHTTHAGYNVTALTQVVQRRQTQVLSINKCGRLVLRVGTVVEILHLKTA